MLIPSVKLHTKYIYIQIFYYQFELTINISGRRMWTTRFTYFDSKCMHLSKLLHNLWSTFFVLIYLLSVRTDNRKTHHGAQVWFSLVFLFKIAFTCIVLLKFHLLIKEKVRNFIDKFACFLLTSQYLLAIPIICSCLCFGI
jgi:hypothetical protein